MCVFVCSWDVGEWSECSKTCGPGFQYRQVICQRTQGHHGNSTVVVATSHCDNTEMPETTTVCQLKICSEWQIRSDWTEVCECVYESCRDMYYNCVVVVQARLCVYSYYRTTCCASCSRVIQRDTLHRIR
ncbi:Thrombospondin type-1 domain-containing protein 4 [Anabarilius grahami]|uniref:Thrombospondin type-1 domain-containing protein 4 n=1 Tax=Anabarilius grahami TaxID=495550 RepID=A0A3N0XH25_ANAGA|nr:Thrombospondin type-1 domain-containing protein 4 [Anabarilius grahami]